MRRRISAFLCLRVFVRHVLAVIYKRGGGGINKTLRQCCGP